MPSVLQTMFRGYNALEVAVELTVIWLGVWMIARFLRNTRGAGVVKGFGIVLALIAIGVPVLAELGSQLGGGRDAFARLRFVADQLLLLLAVALVVVFQP